MNRVEVLAIEPYYGGSHQAFLNSAQSLSRHHWSLITAPARHWKWRMRSSPLALAKQTLRSIDKNALPDFILCSDMLDLPTWMGFIASERSDLSHALLRLPIATYFHESQWDYPVAPGARTDHHYGYTNLLTAAASTACWFNSQFHLESFFDSCKAFIRRMPDSRQEHDLDLIRDRSSVIPPGFAASSKPACDAEARPHQTDRPLRIGWVSRWEHDKRPDQFLALLDRLTSRSVPFDLILLGERAGNSLAGNHASDQTALTTIQDRYANQILVNEYAATRQAYVDSLTMMDVVVSTADHEFFGIGVCEAIAAGAAPVLPDRLSYRELVPENQRYATLDEAVCMLIQFADSDQRSIANRTARRSVSRVEDNQCIAMLDDAIQSVIESH